MFSQATVLMEADPVQLALSRMTRGLVPALGALTGNLIEPTLPRWVIPAKVKPILVTGGVGAYKWCAGNVCSQAQTPQTTE